MSEVRITELKAPAPSKLVIKAPAESPPEPLEGPALWVHRKVLPFSKDRRRELARHIVEHGIRAQFQGHRVGPVTVHTEMLAYAGHWVISGFRHGTEPWEQVLTIHSRVNAANTSDQSFWYFNDDGIRYRLMTLIDQDYADGAYCALAHNEFKR